MGLSTSSFSLALNTYFKVHRNKAAGFAMTLTGFGPIIMPQLVSYLLNKYTVQGCVLILSALALHIIAAALLLQPIKWHLIPKLEEPITSNTFVLQRLTSIKESNTETEMENLVESQTSLNSCKEFFLLKTLSKRRRHKT